MRARSAAAGSGRPAPTLELDLHLHSRLFGNYADAEALANAGGGGGAGCNVDADADDVADSAGYHGERRLLRLRIERGIRGMGWTLEPAHLIEIEHSLPDAESNHMVQTST